MTQSEQTRAILYCRVSDPKQASVRGDGLHSQERTCRDYAERKGYEVVEVFHDSMTGGHIDRPGLQAMLAYLRKHRGTVIVVDHANRLGRDLYGYLQIRVEIENAGGLLESPVMEFKDNSSSRLVENVVASVSQYQRQHNAEQTSSRMKARLQNGYWVFQAPVGYAYQAVRGRGKMLVRDEPVASVVQEALEGYASGRFETQADVMRFLQDNPLFPKDRSGMVRHQRVSVLLNQPIYAGYVERPNWDVDLRLGQHEPLISMQTYQRIQDRLHGINYTPKRPNLNQDFPLRGHVMCADCGTPLTACWSKGTHSRYPYYLCPKKGCESYGKSIRRDKIEGEFENLLTAVTPSDAILRIAKAMFKELWDYQLTQAKDRSKALAVKLKQTESQIGKFLDRIIESNVPSVIATYEERVRKLEIEKQVIKEKMASSTKPANAFEDTLRTALEFLATPLNLWGSGRLEDRRAVLKLAFCDRLEYSRESGFRTANLALPFKVLGRFLGDENKMARPKRFELLTPRFVGGSGVLFLLVFFAKRAISRVFCINSLQAECKTQFDLKLEAQDSYFLEAEGVPMQAHSIVLLAEIDCQ